MSLFSKTGFCFVKEGLKKLGVWGQKKKQGVDFKREGMKERERQRENE